MEKFSRKSVPAQFPFTNYMKDKKGPNKSYGQVCESLLPNIVMK